MMKPGVAVSGKDKPPLPYAVVLRKVTDNVRELQEQLAGETATNIEFELSSKKTFEILENSISSIKSAFKTFSDIVSDEFAVIRTDHDSSIVSIREDVDQALRAHASSLSLLQNSVNKQLLDNKEFNNDVNERLSRSLESMVRLETSMGSMNDENQMYVKSLQRLESSFSKRCQAFEDEFSILKQRDLLREQERQREREQFSADVQYLEHFMKKSLDDISTRLALEVQKSQLETHNRMESLILSQIHSRNHQSSFSPHDHPAANTGNNNIQSTLGLFKKSSPMSNRISRPTTSDMTSERYNFETAPRLASALVQIRSPPENVFPEPTIPPNVLNANDESLTNINNNNNELPTSVSNAIIHNPAVALSVEANVQQNSTIESFRSHSQDDTNGAGTVLKDASDLLSRLEKITAQVNSFNNNNSSTMNGRFDSANNGMNKITHLHGSVPDQTLGDNSYSFKYFSNKSGNVHDNGIGIRDVTPSTARNGFVLSGGDWLGDLRR